MLYPIVGCSDSGGGVAFAGEIDILATSAMARVPMMARARIFTSFYLPFPVQKFPAQPAGYTEARLLPGFLMFPDAR